MTDVVGAFLRGEEVQGAADEIPEGVDGSGLALAQQLFEFSEGHLDRIEIGAVGRQEHQTRPGAGDEVRRLFVLMARQIVEDYRVATRSTGRRICST
jgi:hypothetical protein